MSEIDKDVFFSASSSPVISSMSCCKEPLVSKTSDFEFHVVCVDNLWFLNRVCTCTVYIAPCIVYISFYIRCEGCDLANDLHVRPGAWCTWELCHGGRRSQESAIDIFNHFHLNVLEWKSSHVTWNLPMSQFSDDSSYMLLKPDRFKHFQESCARHCLFRLDRIPSSLLVVLPTVEATWSNSTRQTFVEDLNCRSRWIKGTTTKQSWMWSEFPKFKAAL